MLQQAIAGFFALLTACSLIAIQTAAQVTALPVPAPASSTYATCAGESAIDRASLTALQPEFDRIAALQDKPALADYLAHSHLLGDDAFFHFGTVQDPQEPSRSLPILSQSGLGLPQPEDYLSLASSDQQRRNQYVTHIAHSLALTGETPAQAQADAATILQLETAMARVSLGSQDLRDPARTYHLMPRGDLREACPDAGLERLSLHLWPQRRPLLRHRGARIPARPQHHPQA